MALLQCILLYIRDANVSLAQASVCSEGTLQAVLAPTQARVNVPDDRFRWLCSTYKPKSEVPAFLEIVDIAGLVKYAPYSVIAHHSLADGCVADHDSRMPKTSS